MMANRCLLWLLVLLTCAMAGCGGAQHSGREAGEASERFSVPPGDLGETPPAEPMAPGDTPAPPTVEND